MKSGTPGFTGERLREGREARGLTASALASVVGVTPAAITQYEKNLQTPRPDVMYRIAGALRLPPKFFMSASSRDPGVIFWRSLESATKMARTVAERRLGWVQDMTRMLTGALEFPAINLPSFDLPRDPLAIDDASIERLAGEVRRFWGLGEGPIANVTLMMERNGVVLAREDLEETALDALSKWCPDERAAYCLVSSGKDSAVRARFNVLHELGHLVLHRQLDRWHLENRKLHRLIELQAFKFAGAFALPAEPFAADVFSFSPDAFLTQKAKWKFSVGVMIKRCETLGMLREETAQRLWRGLAARGWRTQEPLDDELPHEHPQLLKQGIEHVLSGQGLARDLVGEYFGVSTQDVEELTGIEGIEANPKLVSLLPRDSNQPPTEKRSSAGRRVVAIFDKGKSPN